MEEVGPSPGKKSQKSEGFFPWRRGSGGGGGKKRKWDQDRGGGGGAAADTAADEKGLLQLILKKLGNGEEQCGAKKRKGTYTVVERLWERRGGMAGRGLKEKRVGTRAPLPSPAGDITAGNKN